jgi:hypothetical protein
MEMARPVRGGWADRGEPADEAAPVMRLDF